MDLTYKTEIEISELVVPSRFHDLLGESEDGFFYPEIEINLEIDSAMTFDEKELYIKEQVVSINGKVVDSLLSRLLLANVNQDDLYTFVYDQDRKMAKEY